MLYKFISTQINYLSDFPCLSDFCWFTPILKSLIQNVRFLQTITFQLILF